MENGMLVELCRRSGRRGRLLVACQATVSTFVILMTTVSCSRPDMPQPAGLFELWFSGPVIDDVNTQLVQPDQAQPKIQRERPKASGSRKVAIVPAPKPAKTSAPRPAS